MELKELKDRIQEKYKKILRHQKSECSHEKRVYDRIFKEKLCF